MATNFSKEWEESRRSIFDKLDQLIRRLEEGDREEELGLDSQGRLKTSIFYGENLDIWLFRAEQCLATNHRLSEKEKIEAAVACFAGAAWTWFLRIESRRPIKTWRELKGLMIDRFRPSQEGNISGKYRWDLEILLEKSEIMVQGSEGPERKWKEKGVAVTSPDSTMISQIPLRLHEKEVSQSPSPKTGKLEYAVEESSCVGLNEEKGKITMKNTKENGLAGGFEIHGNQQLGLVLELGQRMEDKLGPNKMKIKGPTSTNSPMNLQNTPVLNPDLLQLGKQLYHRWREKNTIQRHNEDEPGFFSIKIRGCPTIEAPWESVAVRKHPLLDCNPEDKDYLEEIQKNVAAITLLKAVMHKDLEGGGSGSVLKEIIRGHSTYITGLKSHTWAEVCPLRPNGLGLILEMDQLVKGRLTQLEVVMIQCGTEHKFNSNSWTHISEILCTGATGYGIFLDNILLMGARLATRAKNCNELTPHMVYRYGILNVEVEPNFHLEDKVDFGAAGNDRPQVVKLSIQVC